MKEVTPDFLNALEEKYQAIAHQEIAERENQGLPVTSEWCNELELKHQALALAEIAQLQQGETPHPMKHDHLIDDCLVAAIEVLHTIDPDNESSRTHGSIGVITGVLQGLSESHQLTTEQRTQFRNLIDTWRSVLYSPSPHMKKTG